MAYIRLLRVKHYLKNVLILVPFIFGHKLYDFENYPILLSGFLVFSMVCSVVYIINDLKDVEADRKHPIKCKRPIASGQVRIADVYKICAGLIVASICGYLYIWLHLEHKTAIFSLIVLATYFLMNIWYSAGGGKEIPIIDIIILVLGFLFRVLFGAILTNVKISGWLYLVIITVSFYMALGKRRNELKKHQNQKTRGVLAFYNMAFLDKNMYVCQTLAIAFYALWTVDVQAMNESANGQWAIWTVPLVIIMAMKYSLDIEGESEGDPIEVILGDRMLIGLGILYVFIMYFIIYGI